MELIGKERKRRRNLKGQNTCVSSPQLPWIAPMVICTQCYTELPRECFSANQLNRGKNRCLSCTGFVPPTPSRLASPWVYDGSGAAEVEVSKWITCTQCYSVLPVQFFSNNQLVAGQICMPCIGASFSSSNIMASLSWTDGIASHGGQLSDSGTAVTDGNENLQDATDVASLDDGTALDSHDSEADCSEGPQAAEMEDSGGPQGEDPERSFGATSGMFRLPEEPGEVLVVNSRTSGAFSALCRDAVMTSVVALDAEWKPDTTQGSDNPIAVLQLAFPASMRVYVIQMNGLKGVLPAEVRHLLLNPMIRKAGFAVDTNDVAKFQRSRIRVSPISLLDVQGYCAALLGLPEKSMLGLQRAAEELLGYYGMDKHKRLSCSKWDSPELAPEQVRYAALDAWVTLRLFFYCAQANTYFG